MNAGHVKETTKVTYTITSVVQFQEFKNTKMGNALGYFLTDDQDVSAPGEHSTLQVFVVLKGIFRYLSDSELRNARLVDRHWNFAAMSELVSRRRQLSTIKLYGFSSNQFRDRDYGWYLDFENTRRRLWTDLYGTDCPMLEFRHLHFGYPGKTEYLLKILRSPWLCSVTCLTLSMYSKTCEEFVLDWFLPSLPNLQNLSCIIRPEVYVEELSDLQGLDHAHDSRSNNSLELKPERQDLQMASKLHSFSICFDEACSFQWSLLGSFPGLEELELEFGNAAAMIKCAHDLTDGRVICTIKTLQISLTRKPSLNERVEEAELNAEALAMAAAKLCNQFCVRESLNVIAMIPAASFFGFLDEFTTTGLKQIKFEIAAPLRKTEPHRYMRFRRKFVKCLIPEVLFKFPALIGLHLQFLQYYSSIHHSIRILSSRPILDPALQRRVKQLHISTIPAENSLFEGHREQFAPIPRERRAHFQRWMMFYMSPWFQGLVELDIQACDWDVCVEVIDLARTTFKCVKKLVFRGVSAFVKRTMYSKYFFPEVNRKSLPKQWFFGREVPRQYEGLPGIQSLEVFRVEQFGIFFNQKIAFEVAKKMPRLKLIHLDDQCNNVLPATYSYAQYQSVYKELLPHGKQTSTWPPSIEHVKIRTNTGGRPFFKIH